MSFECMAWAIKQKIGNGIAKAVLLHLADRVNKDTGMCVPKIKTIAADAEFSEESVKRAIKLLRDMKLIEVIHRFHENQQLSNGYKLGPHAEKWEDVDRIPEWALRDPRVGSSRHSEEPVMEPVKEPSLKEEKEKTQPIELPEDFKPSRKQVEFAKKENLNIDACLTNMKRWAIGKRRANWTSVFNKFLEPGRFNQNVLTTAKPSFTPYKPISNEPIVFED